MSTPRSFLSQYGLVVAFFGAFLIAGIGLLVTSLAAVNSQSQDIRSQAYLLGGTGGRPVGGTGGTPAGGSNGNGSGNNSGSAGSSGGSCSQDPINVQFRMATGKETPWLDGNVMTVKVGDVIDANCFAKNGASTLSDADLRATVVRSDAQPVNTGLKACGYDCTASADCGTGFCNIPSGSTIGHCRNPGTDTCPAAATTGANAPATVLGTAGATAFDLAANIVLPGQVRNLKITQPGKYTFTCQGQSDSTRSCGNTDSFVATGTAQAACQPRPACLDATPACKIAEPVDGWCPPAKSGILSDLNNDQKVTIEDYRLFFEDYQKNFSL